ncbi:helix-turn-helix domain-containing protein [Streptomyces sp. NPDC088246]|uniref:nSTAND1 domain-containing NTPase n=1 Tax=Streptomyces sp. NPDC088246 TaxID=3365842 RepID=UPI00382F1AD8
MFAHELRKLRHRAGSPTYRAMARHAPFSAPTLSAAAAGERLPSLPVALAYAAACGGEAAHWEERWRAAASSEPAAAEEQGTAGAPYPGLARFEPGDPLYGRDELTDDVRELTRRHRFAAVVGASGSGKSSLLRASLIPALRTDSGTPLAVIRVLTPGEHPARTHRELLTPSTEPDAGGDTMIVVDQFEEVFALCHDPAERAEFIDLLLAACDPASRLRVLVAVRADFFGRCAEHHALALALRDATVLVGPMAPAQLREAIVGPASAERLVVERALTARLVAEVVDEPGGLPLMSHALLEVWRRRRGRTLTLAAYEAIGGIQGAGPVGRPAAATGRQDAVFTGPSCEGCGRLMAFSPDSRTFAHQSGPTTVSVHPHGSLLQVSDLVGISLDDRSVTVSRSSAAGETIEVGKLKGDPAWSTVYRKRDGSVVATAPDGRFLTELGQSVEPESGRARRVLRGESVVATADYSPDGQYLAMADFFGRVTLWDGAGRRRLAVLAPGADGGLPQPALAFSADSRSVAVGSPDGSVRMWSTEDPGSQGAPLPAADGPVLALAFAAQDSRLRVTTPYTAVRTYPLAPSLAAAAVCSRSRGGLSKNEWQAHLPDVGYRTVC